MSDLYAELLGQLEDDTPVVRTPLTSADDPTANAVRLEIDHAPLDSTYNRADIEVLIGFMISTLVSAAAHSSTLLLTSLTTEETMPRRFDRYLEMAAGKVVASPTAQKLVNTFNEAVRLGALQVMKLDTTRENNLIDPAPLKSLVGTMLTSYLLGHYYGTRPDGDKDKDTLVQALVTACIMSYRNNTILNEPPLREALGEIFRAVLAEGLVQSVIDGTLTPEQLAAEVAKHVQEQ